MKEKRNIYNELSLLSIDGKDDFSNIIFSLFIFIDTLYKKIKEKKYKEIFFLAREGEYLKKLFDCYLKEKKDSSIKSHYLLVSRRATYLASLNDIKNEDFDYLLSQFKSISPLEFIKSLNFNDEETKEILHNVGINENLKIDNFKNSPEFKKICSDNKFKTIYEKRRLEQKKLFIKFLESFTKSKNIAVVDIGWNGSIQDNIEKILDNKYQIEGFYFGLELRNSKYYGSKNGLVFSNYPKTNAKTKLYSENRNIFEMLSQASHASVANYYLDGSTVKASLNPKKEEQQVYKNIIKPIQDKMIKKFKRLINLNIDNDILDKFTNKITFDLFYNPNNKQIEFFKKLCHYENFGVFEIVSFDNKYSFSKKIKEYIKFFIKGKNWKYDTYWPALKLKNNKMRIPYAIYKNKNLKYYKKNCLF